MHITLCAIASEPVDKIYKIMIYIQRYVNNTIKQCLNYLLSIEIYIIRKFKETLSAYC
jgi:hypothetical protein